MSDPRGAARPRCVLVAGPTAGSRTPGPPPEPVPVHMIRRGVGTLSRSAMRRPGVRTRPIGWPWRPQPHRRGPDRTAIDIRWTDIDN
ncbi:hypothetical protein H4W31_000583 [Plantactinospora soyae]|uniref:Uncharacterized protein n=1 Tax=Plantactinospora soyae TaxID=1544732 RepID=A0A927M5Q8_9ACTN|nr:hypothetical protein [Plantactinospora soyae]